MCVKKTMKNDKKIETLVSVIQKDTTKYLSYVKACGPCAYSDRILEDIIENAKKLEEKYEENFKKH